MSPAFWIELLLRSAALLLAGELLRKLSKTQTAAFRHRLLVWVFALLALLPVLSVFLPEIHIPLWAAAHSNRAHVTAEEISSASLPISRLRSFNWPLMVWLIGAAFASTPLLIGALSAWRTARHATPLTSGAFTMPAIKTQILVSRTLPIPLTCGFIRPRILLPIGAEHWSSSRLEAVLSHELAHVRRRDVAVQITTHIIAALWWFQPLAWILRRKLRDESELACDAEALRSGLRPSAYAAELLAIAKSMHRRYTFSSLSISMVHSCDLETRLRAILNTRPTLLRPRKLYALAFALATAAITSAALTLTPAQISDQPGGSTMKRTILSALLTSASLSAATFSGTISDLTGAPIANAHVFVYAPDTGTKQEATTGSDGKFSFSGSAAGQNILRVEKPGFVSLFREFDVTADSTLNRDFTMTEEGGQPVADKVSRTTGETSHALRIGGGVAQSNLISKVQPVYPAAAKAAGTQGTVEIESTISKDGVPVELRVLSSPSDDLSQSALEAVRQWRYRPTLLNGSPIEIVTQVVVNYTLAP